MTTPMKPAEEWAIRFHRTTLVADGETRSPLEVFVSAVQRDAFAAGRSEGIRAAAEVCRERIGKPMDESTDKEEVEWRDDEATKCADAIRALLPHPPTTNPE